MRKMKIFTKRKLLIQWNIPVLMRKQLVQIKIDWKEDRDSWRIIQSSHNKQWPRCRNRMKEAIQRLITESLKRKSDVDFIQAVLMLNVHLLILLKNVNSFQSAQMAIDAYMFIQTANLELSAQIKVAFFNTREKERFQLKWTQWCKWCKLSWVSKFKNQELTQLQWRNSPVQHLNSIKPDKLVMVIKMTKPNNNSNEKK